MVFIFKLARFFDGHIEFPTFLGSRPAACPQREKLSWGRKSWDPNGNLTEEYGELSSKTYIN